MDLEDETNSYLKYFNDTETPNTYLMGNNEVGLFSVEPIFTEMEATDWPSEEFPMLLTNPLIADECSEENISCSEENSNLEGLNNEAPLPESYSISEKTDEEAYINYSPIVNEKPDGIKEIYLTEKDINNDARVIQLLNTDGSVISIDKTVLNSINLPLLQKKNGVTLKKTKTVNDLFSTVIANKCKICSFLCESFDEIKDHISEKHPESLKTSTKGESNGTSLLIQKKIKNKVCDSEVKKEYTVYICSVCHDVCTNKKDLKSHMIQAHDLVSDEDDFIIDDIKQIKENNGIPPKTTNGFSKLALSLVKKQEKAMRIIKCTTRGCLAGFPSKELQEKHENMHVNHKKNDIKCVACDQTFSIWRIARNHIWNEHQIDFGMISCPMCDFFKSYSAVKVIKHMAIHAAEKPFFCAVCGKSFKQLSQLKNHEILHKPLEEVPSWYKIKKCDLCDRFFANSKSLKKHVQSIHENLKPFICSTCGHTTTRKSLLELHLRQHTGAKPHKCAYCAYKTGDPNCLRRHMMKHAGLCQYKCRYCPYTCIQSISLKSHLTRKHPGKTGTFTCRYCPYTSVNETSLLSHQKQHEVTAKNGANGPESDDGRVKRNATELLQVDDATQNCFLNSVSPVEEFQS